MSPPPTSVIVVGASAGGVEALLTLAQSLPPDLPAAVCVVLHVGAQPSMLPELLRARGPLAAVHAQDGLSLQPGTFYVAPPDRHLLLEPRALRLSHGPKENHARPAVDPLFRSAALHWGERAIGVVLSGQLDDGAAGLVAIKDAGGTTLVQDPATALEPGMPRAALASCAVDGCLPVEALAARLAQLAGTPFPPGVPRPDP